MSVSVGLVLAAVALALPASALIPVRVQDASNSPVSRTLRDLGGTLSLADLSRGVQDEGFTWAFREARLDPRGAWVWTEGRRMFACAEARWWMRDEIVVHAPGGKRGEDRLDVLDLATYEFASWSRAPGDSRGDVLLQFVRRPAGLWWMLQGFVDPRLANVTARDVRQGPGKRVELRFTNFAGFDALASLGTGSDAGWFEHAMEHERGSVHVLTGPPLQVRTGARRVPAWVLERESRDGALTAIRFHVLLGAAHAPSPIVPEGAAVLDYRQDGTDVRSRALDRPTPLVELAWNAAKGLPRRLEPTRTSFAVGADCDLDHDDVGAPTASAGVRSKWSDAAPEPRVFSTSDWKPSEAGERLLADVAGCNFGFGLAEFDAPCPDRADGRHIVTVRAVVDPEVADVSWAVGSHVLVPHLSRLDAADDAAPACSRCGAAASAWPRTSRERRGPPEQLARPPVRVRTADELVLQRVPGADRPVGTLVLASGPAAEPRLSLVGFESGCGITVRGSLPIDIPKKGVEVLFEASATRSFDPGPQGLANLKFDAGPPLRLGVRVIDPAPPCRVVPAAIDLSHGDELDVAILMRDGDAVAVRDLVAPGCVRIEVAHACARLVRLQVRESADARRPHVCGPVVGLVERGGRPPYTLIARIEHGPVPRHGPDAVPLHLVLEPAADFLLAEDRSGRLRAVHPQRSPAVATWIDALGWRVLARGRVRDEKLVLEPGGASGTLPVLDASFASELSAYQEAWKSGG